MASKALFLSTLLVPMALSLSSRVFADADSSGGEAGGGENAVVCFDDTAIPAAIRDHGSVRFGEILDDEIKTHVTSIEAYDLFEARMPRGISGIVPQILDIETGESVRDYSERIAKRYENYIPDLARTIRYGSSAFPEDKIILRPAGLDRVHDEHDVGYIDSLHCVVATMARQYHSGAQIFLQIDRRLFQSPKHSILSQAVLFLHESVYYAARALSNHENSRATRALVGVMINRAAQGSLKLGKFYVDLHMPDFYSRYQGSYILSSLAVLAAEVQPDIEKSASAAARKASTGKLNVQLVEEFNQLEALLHPAPPSGEAQYWFNRWDRGPHYRKRNTYFGDGGFGNILEWPSASDCNDTKLAERCLAQQKSVKRAALRLRADILAAARASALEYVKAKVFPVLDARFGFLGPAVIDQAKALYLSKISAGVVAYDTLEFTLENFSTEFDAIGFAVP